MIVRFGFCMMMGIGGGVDGLAYRFHNDVMKELGISHQDVQQIILDSTLNMQKVEELTKMI